MKISDHLLIISLILCLISKGQDVQTSSSERANVQGIKCYPLSLLLPGALSLGYERKLSDRFSAEIGSSWYWKDFWSRDFLETYTNIPASGADVSLSLRYKLGIKKVWPGGWSTRAQLMYKRLNNHDFVDENEGNIRDSLNVEKQVMACKLLIAYRLRVSKHLFLEVYAGPGIRWKTATETRFSRLYLQGEQAGFEDRTIMKHAYFNWSPNYSPQAGISLGYFF